MTQWVAGRLVVALAVASNFSTVQAEVRYVGAGMVSASGLGILQDTVDLANDGDVIVIQQCWNPLPTPCFESIGGGGFIIHKTYDTHRTGTYNGVPATGALVIDGKDLTFFGSNAGNQIRPIIGGPVLILGDANVQFRGLQFWGVSGKPQATPEAIDPFNVRIVDSTSAVLFEDCLFLNGSPSVINSNTAFLHQTSANIELVGGACELVLNRCDVYGKTASSTPTTLPKAGIAAVSGAHRIAIYDSLVVGGWGANLPDSSEDGADGVVIGDGSEVYFVRSETRGGTAFILDMAAGGDGLEVAPGGAAFIADSTFDGGLGGFLGGTDGQPIAAAIPGTVTRLAASPRSCVIDSEGTGMIASGEPIVIEHVDTASVPQANQGVLQVLGEGLTSLPLNGLAAGLAHILDPIHATVHTAIQGSVTTSATAPAVPVTEPLVFLAQGVFGPLDGFSPYALSSPSVSMIVDPSVKIFTPIF